MGPILTFHTKTLVQCLILKMCTSPNSNLGLGFHQGFYRPRQREVLPQLFCLQNSNPVRKDPSLLILFGLSNSSSGRCSGLQTGSFFEK